MLLLYYLFIRAQLIDLTVQLEDIQAQTREQQAVNGEIKEEYLTKGCLYDYLF
jgi:hypothetical protein